MPDRMKAVFVYLTDAGVLRNAVREVFDVSQWLTVMVFVQFVQMKTKSSHVELVEDFLSFCLCVYFITLIVKVFGRNPFNYEGKNKILPFTAAIGGVVCSALISWGIKRIVLGLARAEF